MPSIRPDDRLQTGCGQAREQSLRGYVVNDLIGLCQHQQDWQRQLRQSLLHDCVEVCAGIQQRAGDSLQRQWIFADELLPLRNLREQRRIIQWNGNVSFHNFKLPRQPETQTL